MGLLKDHSQGVSKPVVLQASIGHLLHEQVDVDQLAMAFVEFIDALLCEGHDRPAHLVSHLHGLQLLAEAHNVLGLVALDIPVRDQSVPDLCMAELLLRRP